MELIVKYQDRVIERIVTEKKRITIGRTNDNNVVLENRGVSRVHAIINVTDDGVVLVDNETLNGTFVNNRKISEEKLRNNDEISIGRYVIVFHAVPAPGSAYLADEDAVRFIPAKHTCKLVTIKCCTEPEYPIEKCRTDMGYNQEIRIRALLNAQASILWNGDTGTCTLIKNSAIGTVKKNDQRVKGSVALRHNDTIQVGRSVFRVEIH